MCSRGWVITAVPHYQNFRNLQKIKINFKKLLQLLKKFEINKSKNSLSIIIKQEIHNFQQLLIIFKHKCTELPTNIRQDMIATKVNETELNTLLINKLQLSKNLTICRLFF